MKRCRKTEIYLIHADQPRNDMNDFDRFELAASQMVGKRVTWNEVTGKITNRERILTEKRGERKI